MLIWMPFSYRSCRSRRATELLGSPCKGPRVLSDLASVNALYVWTFCFSESQIQPVALSPHFSYFSVSEPSWPCPGWCELLAFCLIPVSGPFCRSRVSTGYIPIFPVLFLTRLCHLQPILYKVCNSSILARGSLFFPGNTVLIYCSICAIHDALCKNVKWELGSYK